MCECGKTFDLGPFPRRLGTVDEGWAEERVLEVRHTAGARLPRIELLLLAVTACADRPGDDGITALMRVEHAAGPVGRGQRPRCKVPERRFLAERHQRFLLHRQDLVALSH
jgi:hypothetical protein